MGSISFLCNLENFFGITSRRNRKTIHTTKRRIIVRFTDESSSKPILITGNANAQNITGVAIIKNKYFFADSSFFSLRSGIR